MATNNALQYDTILKTLQDKELTITAISDITKLGYYTVRARLEELLLDHRVEIVRIENRHRVYAINKVANVEQFIPNLVNTVTRRRHKAVTLLASVGHEKEMQSVVACSEVPKLIVELLYLANEASHGIDVSSRLEDNRRKWQRNYLAINNANEIHRQMLQSAEWWDISKLQDFVKDVDYNADDIFRAYDYYFKDK